MRIKVQGIGPVGGFGAGVNDLLALFSGTENLAGIYKPETARIERDGKILELPWFRAKSSKIEEFIPKKKLRRIDRFSTLALLGASLAISAVGFSPGEVENTGIIVATGYGAAKTTFSFLDSFLDKGDSLSMPTHFSNSVHNAAAAHISILLGIKGPSLTVSQFDLSVPSAFFTAINWILEERVESVLVGGIDEYTSVLGYATAGFNEKSNASSAISGEGGCFFLLSREDKYKKRGYCTLEKAAIFDPTRSPITMKHPVIMGSRGYGACNGPKLDIPCISYGFLYGDFPAAAAIDIGVGCLSLKNGKIFNPFPDKGSDDFTLLPKPEEILCLKPGNDHLWGAVTLNTDKRSS